MLFHGLSFQQEYPDNGPFHKSLSFDLRKSNFKILQCSSTALI